MLFSQTPIEASIWTSFVASQQWIVVQILDTALFKSSVLLWMSYLLIKAIYQTSVLGRAGEALGRFLATLLISALGFSCLRLADGDFRVLNADQGVWSSMKRVASSSRYQSLSSSGNLSGLEVYRTIHSGAIEISDRISTNMASLYGDDSYNQSPYLFLQTMARTAASAIDDPEAISILNWLLDNCSDNRSAPILDTTSSYSAIFDLKNNRCLGNYKVLIAKLDRWSEDRWEETPISKFGIERIASNLGLGDERIFKNKMIASALVNTAKAQSGNTNAGVVNTKALLGDTNVDPHFDTSTSSFVSLANAFSVGGFFHKLLSPWTGKDIWGADARNQSAYLYNRIVQFLPPIRGFAKGAIALMFVFAAAAMCFGSLRYMVAWFGMLFIFTAYEPLSTLLYQTTIMFTRSPQIVEAMEALKNDPLILAGAAVIDSSLARIQAVYFVLQLSLTFMCAAGGISCFFLTRQIGGGLSDSIAQKVSGIVRLIPLK
jgi:hypothetical protein